MKRNISYLKNMTFAHRGIHDNAIIPENSKASFQKAMEENYAIELDIQYLKDNTIVVFHDDNLKRMTGKDTQIQNETYQDIKKLHLLNTTFKIPTFEEVLKQVNGKVLINIEIKKTERYQELLEQLFSLLDAYLGKFIIQSFDFRILRYLKKKRPNYIRGLLIKEQDKFLMHFINSFLTRSHYLKVDFISHSRKGLTSKGIQKRRKKKFVFVWTIKEQDISKYKDLADGFIFEK